MEDIDIKKKTEIESIWNYIELSSSYINKGIQISLAKMYLEKAVTFALKNSDDYLLASSFKELGRLYLIPESYQKSFQYITKALEIYQKIGNKKNEFDTYNLMGILCCKLEDYHKGIQYYKKSNQFFENHSKYLKKSCSINKNIGIAYLYLKDYTNSKIYLEKSINIEHQQHDKKFYARMLASIGFYYAGTNQFVKAKELFTKSLDIFIELNDYIE